MYGHVVLAAWITNHWADVGTIVSLAIAFVAAFRPELHALLRPRKIDLMPSDSFFLEMGFDTFGPTLGMVGNINNEHARSIIRKLRIRVSIPDNNSELVLTPVYNRMHEIGDELTGSGSIRGTLWLLFLIEDDVLVSFDVLFRSDAVSLALTKIGYGLGKAWAEYYTNSAQQNKSSWVDPDPATQDSKLAQFKLQLYNTSLDAEFMTEVRTAMTDAFAWRAGLYQARLEVDVLNCRRVFSRNFTFSISEEDIQRLLINVNTIIAAICVPEAQSAQMQAIFTPIKVSD